ncbi:MAG: hypothetical protein ABUK01_02610 [Leptospirales bacterium]
MLSQNLNSTFKPEPLSASTAAGVDALREYLERIGFHQLYKYIASSSLYGSLPSAINHASAPNVAEFFATVLADYAGLELAQCLMIGHPFRSADLSPSDRETADKLVAAGVLAVDGERLAPTNLQLINAFGVDLLIDRRINFPCGSLHDVYIGIDSYLMLYYINSGEIERDHRALDLCTGSGIAALYASLYCDDVIATDVGLIPLRLVQMNRQLNDKSSNVAVRNQPLDETLDGSTKVNLLTCNPPFVAFPPGVNTTLYSHGTDIDGLGYLRTIIDRLPNVLLPKGSAYLVADLVGDNVGPHFVKELQERALKGRFSVDVYIDGVLTAEDQVPAFTAHLASANPDRDRKELREELRAFQRDILKADKYYLSTIRVQMDIRPGEVRVFRRHSISPVLKYESWPEILLAK